MFVCVHVVVEISSTSVTLKLYKKRPFYYVIVFGCVLSIFLNIFQAVMHVLNNICARLTIQVLH